MNILHYLALWTLFALLAGLFLGKIFAMCSRGDKE
jgi:hypothetical protein